MSHDVLLRAVDLTRRIAGRTLLDHVGLELIAGMRLGLVGPTGSGKSLLLRSLALLEPIDSGQLFWRTESVSSDRATRYRSQVIYVHQRAAGFEGTVESILRQPLQLKIHRGRSFDRDWIIDQLATVSRDATFLDQPHEQLSGGESQIVALLRAIQLSPCILLLDEPTSALDRQSARHVESIVMRWYEEKPDGRAFIWVSHDPSQADRVCDSLITMDAGQIQRLQHPTS
ncbi:putative ABC transporter ATP-binding protein YbbL [Stieleria maiorica]|uniref:Putative ABC transporter ATP-binding protein YbbL n=1 Tax=Stieleria maiorica TaxID=2795974 RepID=A0A5B9MNS8_9BACT|nr:ATP-binding cassette domain-containing protein [Stieleria maiorica]QEG01266.1 putative ABC transporter ATP-binding protein YbbL [Stieleria maiorica]